MQIKSRNNKFYLGAPADAKYDKDFNGFVSEEQYEEEQRVIIVPVGGVKEVTMYDLAYTIFNDCFSIDSYGLGLLTKKLRCLLITAKATYEFSVKNENSFDEVLESIACQLIL